MRPAASQFSIPKCEHAPKIISVCHNNTKHYTSNSHTSQCYHGLQRGPNSVLTPAEEQKLQDWLVEMAKIGYGKSGQQL